MLKQNLAIFLLALLANLALGQEEVFKAGVPDYSIARNRTVKLIARCETGIDSFHFDLDSNFTLTVEYYTADGEVTNPTAEHFVIAHLYQFKPKSMGTFKLNDGILWSQGKAYSLQFTDSIIVHEEIKPSVDVFSQLHTQKSIDFMPYLVEMKSRKPKARLWFEKPEYASTETVKLIFLVNQVEVELPESFNANGVEHIVNTSKSFAINHNAPKHLKTYSAVVWEFTPIEDGEIRVEPMTIKVGRKEVKTTAATCIVR